MKKMPAYSVILPIVLFCASCGGKQATVQGTLVDWNSKPVPGIKMLAAQTQPVEGFEQCETVTAPDGSFQISGLLSASQYVLKPYSDKWFCDVEVVLDSPPPGKTMILPQPVVISRAYAIDSGSVIADLASGAARFIVSSDGVITDTVTNLEWIVGPDEDTTHTRAEEWIAACNATGGGWRMPTGEELAGLYLAGAGKRNMDPVFKTTGWCVWAEPVNPGWARLLRFRTGKEDVRPRYTLKHLYRVFGVRLPAQE